MALARVALGLHRTERHAAASCPKPTGCTVSQHDVPAPCQPLRTPAHASATLDARLQEFPSRTQLFKHIEAEGEHGSGMHPKLQSAEAGSSLDVVQTVILPEVFTCHCRHGPRVGGRVCAADAS